MKTIAIVSDSHCNSTVGLAKPDIKLDDGDRVSAGVLRRWIFNQFEGVLEEIDKKKRGQLVGVINGDAIELDDKDRSLQLITHNTTEAVQIAVDVFTPFFEMAHSVYVVRGTTAHVGKSAQGEEALARNFDNTVPDPDSNSQTWRSLLLECEGVRLDIMHHPPSNGGGRPMNSQSLIARIAADTLFQYANRGKLPPHFVVRSHLHGYRDSGNSFRTRAIITPALSLLTEYAYRIGINESEPIGAILIYCENGQYEVEPILRKAPERSWQIL